jgi:hypothetical protein
MIRRAFRRYALPVRLARVAILVLVAAVAGTALGLWTAQMSYTTSCGPNLFCVIFLVRRFAAWQSALIGAATLTLILVVSGTVNSDLRSLNVGALRFVQRWRLQLAPVLAGVGVGLWTAQLAFTCATFSCPPYAGEPRFAAWQCALFGAAVAVPLLVASFALRRPAET